MTTHRGRHGPTIIDVAQAAGVSRQTVSNALNAPRRLHPDTLARVLAVVERLGYVPNRMARSLRTQDTRQIGYRLDPEEFGPVGVSQDRFLYSLTSAAEAEGYLLLLFCRGRTGDELARYADMLRTGTVDGFVLSGVGPDDPRPPWLKRRQTPFVCYGRPPTTGPDDLWVAVDAAAGTAAAVDHLVAAGHRTIGFIGWPGTSGQDEPRLTGWRRAMRGHGLGTDACDHALDTPWESTRGALRLLSRTPVPTAVVAASDAFALGCYAAARHLGLEVGRDLAVVGFGDCPTASLITPALTSVGPPFQDIGRAMIRLLVARLREQVPEEPGVLLAPSLVVRDSARAGPPDRSGTGPER
ncbi:LacI family DNA-binding transcriptional regulator [Streptomyces sp.]|uniref:LacI family DNA-binding transcriptional regulator n=1 Tax=Streptomyces sp. TaxID=1931 RepID=UPI002F429338